MSKADLEEIQKATGMSLGGASIPDALSKAKQSRGEKKARKVNLDELATCVCTKPSHIANVSFLFHVHNKEA